MATFNDYPENALPADTDILISTDISDTTDDPSGSTKKLPLSILKTYTNNLIQQAAAPVGDASLFWYDTDEVADSYLQTVAVPANISASGTPSATTFLRGDGAWAEAGLAGPDDKVIAHQPLLNRIDERSTELTYAGDDLTQVLEKDGATTVKQTDLTYTAGKLTSVVELADSITVTTTLTYTGDKLTSTGRVVS
jgi:phage baseplate assembly protein gpV